MLVFEQWDTVRPGAREEGGCCSRGVTGMWNTSGDPDVTVSAGSLENGGSCDKNKESY